MVKDELENCGASQIAWNLTSAALSYFERDTASNESPILNLFHAWNDVCERIHLVDKSLTADEDYALTNELSDECRKIEKRMLALPAENALDIVAKFFAYSGGGDFLVDDPSVLAEAASWLAAPTSRDALDIARSYTTERQVDDPLLALFAEYRAQSDWLSANGVNEATVEWKAMDTANIATINRMSKNAPKPNSLAGVAAAIRYALDEDALIDNTAKGPLKAALAYLDEAQTCFLTESASGPVVTAISPTLGKVFRSSGRDVDTQLKVLVDQFKEDAKAIDPTIKGAWIGHDMSLDDREQALMSIYFERDHAPFVRRSKA